MNADQKFLVQLLVVLVIFFFFFRFVLKKAYRSTITRESKKLSTLSEKKLRKRYKNARNNRNNKFLSWYISGGLYYKIYREHVENLYQLYQEEMNRRSFIEEEKR